MVPAPVPGGLEPQLLPADAAQAIRGAGRRPRRRVRAGVDRPQPATTPGVALRPRPRHASRRPSRSGSTACRAGWRSPRSTSPACARARHGAAAGSLGRRARRPRARRRRCRRRVGLPDARRSCRPGARDRARLHGAARHGRRGRRARRRPDRRRRRSRPRRPARRSGRAAVPPPSCGGASPRRSPPAGLLAFASMLARRPGRATASVVQSTVDRRSAPRPALGGDDERRPRRARGRARRHRGPHPGRRRRAARRHAAHAGRRSTLPGRDGDPPLCWLRARLDHRNVPRRACARTASR